MKKIIKIIKVFIIIISSCLILFGIFEAFILPHYITAEKYTDRGNAFLNAGKYEKALAMYDKALSLDNSYAEAYNYKGIAYQRQGNYMEAIDMFYSAISLDYKDAKFNKKKAIDEYLACRYMPRGIKEDEIYRIKGVYLSDIECYGDATSYLERAIRKNPANIQAYSDKANVLQLGEWYREGIDASDEGLKVDPDFVDLYITKGDCLRGLERYDEALNVYDNGIKVYENQIQETNSLNSGLLSVLYSNKGSIFQQLGKDEDAKKMFDMANELDKRIESPALVKGIEVLSDWKMIINGKSIKCINKPLAVSNEVFLQLNETLAYLGISDDDKHIISDAEKKTVTIINGTQEIAVTVGSNIARVNKSQVVLDSAPVYNTNRVYVPVSLIERIFNKKVILDETSKSVLIKGNADFDRIKGILKKTSNAMSDINKVKYSMVTRTNIIQDDEDDSSEIIYTGEVDRVNKVLHYKMEAEMALRFGSAEVYYYKNNKYTQVADKWERTALSKDEIDKTFGYNSNLLSFKFSDILSAGLVKSKVGKSDEIVLNGDVYLDSLLEDEINSTGNSTPGIKFDKLHLVMTLEKKTYLIKNVVMSTTISGYQEDGTPLTMSMSKTYTYSNYNGRFKVKVPESVLNNAVE